MQDLRIMMFGFIGDEKQVEDIFQREPSPQLSAVKFQRAIVDGLVESGAAVSILSSMPIASYPTNKLVIHGHPFTLSGGRAHGRVMGFINLPVVKLFNRFLSALVYGTRMVRQQQVNMIFCYSLHTPFLLTAILLRKLTGIAVTVMINDLPMNMAGKPERGLRAIAKQLDNRLLNSLASRADLILPVAKGIIDDWVPSAKEYLVIDAIAPNDLAPLPAKAVGGRRTILYAGNLSHVINFATLFHHARDLDAQLVFVGGGAEEAALKSLAAVDSRITVKPFMRGEEFQRQLQQADFFVNARSSTWQGGRYAFSYKLFDYMSSGRPILSTPMPGIPREYFDCFLRVDDTSQDEFYQSMSAALASSPEVLQARTAVGLSMMANEKSSRHVGKRIVRAMSLAVAASERRTD